jgi:hypothetical protein
MLLTITRKKMLFEGMNQPVKVLTPSLIDIH